VYGRTDSGDLGLWKREMMLRLVEELSSVTEAGGDGVQTGRCGG